MFKGAKPPSQPRSLRSIAESNNAGSFPPEETAPVYPGVYRDEAAAALPPASMARQGVRPVDPKPLANLKGG